MSSGLPPIAPVPDGEARPFWSVMIPTYRTDPRFLRAAIESVLAANIGPPDMQVEVVNDGDAGDVAALAEHFAPRVQFHTNERNLGAPANFTECARRATGRWVHILHADDAVQPDFYESYRAVIDHHPECAAVGGQAIWIDEHDEWFGVSPVVTVDDELLRDPTATIAARHPCNFATMVVAHRTYEAVGGFDATLPHANDWEMWTRVSTAGPIGWVTKPHAYYRRHSASDSALVQQSSAYVAELLRAIEINGARIDDPPTREWARAAAHIVLSDYALGNAVGHLAGGRRRAAIRDAYWGVRVRPNLSTLGRAADTIGRAVAISVRVRLRRP